MMRFFGLREYGDGSIFIETSNDDYSDYKRTLLICPNDDIICQEKTNYESYKREREFKKTAEDIQFDIRRAGRIRRYNNFCTKSDEVKRMHKGFINNYIDMLEKYYDAEYNKTKLCAKMWFDKFQKMIQKDLTKFDIFIKAAKPFASRYVKIGKAIPLSTVASTFKSYYIDDLDLNVYKNDQIGFNIANTVAALINHKERGNIHIISPLLIKYLQHQFDHQGLKNIPCNVLKLLPYRNMCLYLPNGVIAFIRPDDIFKNSLNISIRDPKYDLYFDVLIPLDSHNSIEECMTRMPYNEIMDDKMKIPYSGLIISILMYMSSSNAYITNTTIRNNKIKLVGFNMDSLVLKSYDEICEISRDKYFFIDVSLPGYYRYGSWIMEMESCRKIKSVKWSPIYHNIE